LKYGKESFLNAYNVFLNGKALSVVFGLIGAWIALGKLPSFTR